MNNTNLKDLKDKRKLVVGKKVKIIKQDKPHTKDAKYIELENWKSIRILNPFWNASENLNASLQNERSIIYKTFYNYSTSRINDNKFFYGEDTRGRRRWWYYIKTEPLKKLKDFAEKIGWDPQFYLWNIAIPGDSLMNLSKITTNDSWSWSEPTHLRGFAQAFMGKILDREGRPTSKEALEILKLMIENSSFPTLDIIYQEGAELDGIEFINDEVKNDFLVTIQNEEAKNQIDEQKLAEKNKEIAELQAQLKKQAQLKEDYNNLLIQLKELTEALAKSKEKTDQDKADEIIKLNQRIEILQKMLTGGPGSQQPTDDEANQEKIIAANIATATAQSQVAKLLERVGQLNEEVSRLKEQNTIAQVEMPAKVNV